MKFNTNTYYVTINTTSYSCLQKKYLVAMATKNVLTKWAFVVPYYKPLMSHVGAVELHVPSALQVRGVPPETSNPALHE